MFDRYSFIHKHHRVALESVVRNHSVASTINAPLLAKMYQLAQQGLQTNVVEDGFHASKINSETLTLSSVTEAKTGFWVQLAKSADHVNPFLTVGQKWVMEQPIAAFGNVSTVIW